MEKWGQIQNGSEKVSVEIVMVATTVEVVVELALDEGIGVEYS